MYHEEHSQLNGHFTPFFMHLYITVKQIFNSGGAAYCIFVVLRNNQRICFNLTELSYLHSPAF